MLFPALTLQMSARRRPCVLDPALALTRHGAAIARGLAELMEVWVVKEHWRILDNTFLYLDQPELLAGRPRPGRDSARAAREAREALQEWERLRLVTDPLELRLCWVGDRADESLLPPGVGPEIVDRWTALAAALGRRADPSGWSAEPIATGWIHAAALAAALGPAVVVTGEAEGADDDAPPSFCAALAGWGVPTEAPPDGHLLALEREHVCQVLMHGGLARFVWAGLRLSIVHVVAPDASLAPPPDELDRMEEDEVSGTPPDLWLAAKTFWFDVR